jgi:acetone carboxylase, beta subunit
MSDAVTPVEGDGEYILALDAGGTMTDAILVKPDGGFTVGKSITRRDDEPRSYRESVADAAESIGLKAADVHANCAVDIYCGTGMLNTILTGTGRRIGLLVTRGFEDITVMEGGLTYLGQTQAETLHQQLHKHPRSLINHSDVRGVSERVCGGSLMGDKHLEAGHVLIPLNEDDVRKGAEELIERGVDTIGILFVYSFTNPTHEHRAKEIVQEILDGRKAKMPVVCSVDVAPVSRENNRLKSLLFQCFAAEEIRDGYLYVEQEAKIQGYAGRLLTLLSYGGAVNMDYPRLYETMISGPIGGLMGAQFIGDKLGLENVVTADMGGTSFDVGLIIQGRIGIQKSADIAGHRLALPMVELDSIGAGAGSAVTLDEYKRLHIGPDSAGAKVGCCLDYDQLTVTDINVALGYVDPDYFLGGQVKLDRDRALKMLEEVVAKPLGLDVYEAGAGVLEVVNTEMRELLSTMVATKGYNTNDFTLLYYGGAGPVHMWGYTEGIEFADVITLPWAAGFSAFGAACAEYMHRYDRSVSTLIPNNISEADGTALAVGLRAVWAELEAEARQELEHEGVDSSQATFRYGFSGRYIGQLESFETPIDSGRMEDSTDIQRLVDAFEKMYTNVYPEGARFPDAGYSITTVNLEAVAPKPQPVLHADELAGETPPEAAYVETRKAYHRDAWFDFQVWEMAELKAGNVVKGPAIIRDPMTTVVIPPGKVMEFDQYRILHYR